MFVMTWMNAAQMQASRILDALRQPGTNVFDDAIANQVTLTSDTLTYPICLSLVRRSAILAMRYADQQRDHEIRDALERFDNAVPDVVKVRNILSHFDEYAEGAGRLQTDPADPGTGLWHTIRHTTDIGRYGETVILAHHISLSIAVTSPAIELDVVSSLRAGRDLTETVVADIPIR
jgi:hypothetical protein